MFKRLPAGRGGWLSRRSCLPLVCFGEGGVFSSAEEHEHERGAKLELREDEVAFYDAICQNDSAVLEMGDELLKKITRGSSTRCAATPLSTGARKSRYARMRAVIRRLLTRYGNPPDKQPTAIELVMHHAELLAQAAL